MNTLVKVGQTDITPYMDHKSYSLKVEDVYESWQDGNFREHRIYTRSKYKGSFKVWLCGKDGMDVDAFKTLWASVKTGDKVLIQMFDEIKGTSPTYLVWVEAFYKITPVKHHVMLNGNYFDVFQIEVTEA